MARLVRRLLPVSAPLAVLALVLGCPRDASDSATADATPSSSPSPSLLPAASSAAPTWPKVVVVPDPPPPEPDDAASLEEIEALDAELADAEAADAVLDAFDVLDASDTDARPDTKKVDAYEDAPLFGTKTYPDENPVRGIRKITSGAAKVHKAPKDKDIIATLPKGTEVSLVAEIFDWYRVRYSDPNTGQRRQGWVYLVNFAGPRTKTCPLGWMWHPQDGGWCDRECTKNTDCKALKGYKCSGTMCFYAGD